MAKRLGIWTCLQITFFGGGKENIDEYVLKPMSCPAHILLFKRGT